MLTTKLRNAILRIKTQNLEFYLKNTTINGVKVGCFGFVKNTENGKIAYVNTEKSRYYPLADKNLYRTAKDLKDYTGGHNNFATDKDIAMAIVNMIK